MCLIAQHTIDNYPRCQNIHNQIDGGDFALSSSPRLITIYTSCKWGQNRGHYKNLRYQLEKRRWEVKIKLSWYTPSLTPSQPKEDLNTSEVSTFTNITIEEIYLGSYVIHLMTRDLMQGIVLRNQSQQRRATKEDIMLMLQRMMNHLERDPDMKVKILNQG